MDAGDILAVAERAGGRFEGLAFETASTGAPILPGTAVALDCRVVAAHAAGDHVIYVGEVEWARVDESREPLLYASGAYGRFERG